MLTGQRTLHWKDRSHRFTPHFHVEFYVGVVVQGVCEFHCAGRDHAAHAGDVVLINPYEVHTAGCSADVEYRAVYIDEQTVTRIVLPLSGAGTMLSLEPTVVKQSPDAGAFATALASSRALGDISAPLAAILMKHAVARAVNIDARAFQQRVLSYLEGYRADAFGTLPIRDLAAEFSMTPQAFSRVFHRAFGVPAVFFRNQLRLHLAEQKLSQGGRASAVALECGYSDQAHLIRELKKSRGVTPKVYATAYQVLTTMA